jgi:organic hydroperoxide reductase OsmC/OhrA
MFVQDDGQGSHRYNVHCQWTGSTGVGYETFNRAHTASALPARIQLELSSDPAFCGDPELLNPEQLVVLAAASCQLLSFLAVAARARIDVLGYDDEGVGVMTDDSPPMHLTSILLRPTIRVAPGTSVERVMHLVEVAHQECYIANSLLTEVEVEPTVVIDSASPH